MHYLFGKAGNSVSATNSLRLLAVFLGTMFLTALTPPARGGGIINFETLPALPPQPNNFFAAGPMQTFTQVGVFSITGGVVLGNPNFLTSFASQGSTPNLYGTADFADPSLLDTISLTFPAAEMVTSVSGV